MCPRQRNICHLNGHPWRIKLHLFFIENKAIIQLGKLNLLNNNLQDNLKI